MIYFPKKAYSKIIISIYFCKVAVLKYLANNSIILPIFSTIFTIDLRELDLRDSQNMTILYLVSMIPVTWSEKKLKLKLQKSWWNFGQKERECLKHKADVIITKQGVC